LFIKFESTWVFYDEDPNALPYLKLALFGNPRPMLNCYSTRDQPFSQNENPGITTTPATPLDDPRILSIFRIEVQSYLICIPPYCIPTSAISQLFGWTDFPYCILV